MAESRRSARGARDRHRRALGVNPEERARNLARLKRIEGQVRGIQRMIEQDRYCADILTQISAVHEALRGVGRELMRHHLRHCATAALRGSPAEAGAMHEEILDLMYTHVR
jgi:DNA-binding FrmR family transcriptional regulator